MTAYGYTKYGFYTYLIGLIVLMPLMIIFVSMYGAVGGASVWAFVNAIQALILVHFTHKRFLTGEHWRWYFEDVGRPLFAALIVVSGAKVVIGGQVSGLAMVASLVGVLVVSVLAAACVVPTAFLAIKRVVYQEF